MSIYLEFPSIEDYPVYSAYTEGQSADGLIPASPFNWLLSLEFSAIKFPGLDAAAETGEEQAGL